jgi:hypothetical protein
MSTHFTPVDASEQRVIFRKEAFRGGHDHYRAAERFGEFRA